MPNSTANSNPSPSRTCGRSWSPIPVTAAAGDTPGRTPDLTPTRCGTRSARISSATACRPNRSSSAAEPPRPSRAADRDRPADDLAGEDDVRCALGGCVLAVVMRAADDDLDVVDRRAGAVGQPEVQPAELHVEFDDHHRTREPRPRQGQLHKPHPRVRGEPRRNDPLALTLE